MSCKYYHWDGNYACMKADCDVSEETYYKYCRNYDYEDCSIYKAENDSDSGYCYLTTACVTAKNLPDNCHELETLRHFRDNWLAKQEGGQCEIKEYYIIAPKIVTSINANENAREIWERLYRNLVLPCVSYIENGENEKAHKLYRETTLILKEQFL